MKIKCLSVSNFRNLSTQKIHFSPGLNVLYGKNAQGKTNTLEAVYCATIGRSPRTRKDSDMINFSHNQMGIELQYAHHNVEHSVQIQLKGASKNISLHGNKLTKISDVLGNFGSVYFSPEELHLVQGSPIFRRRFIDIINCQLSKNYLNNLQYFKRLLNQRNALLKNKGVKEEQVSVWNEQLVRFGTDIFIERYKFCEKLHDFAHAIHKELSDGKEDLEIVYNSISEQMENRDILQKKYLESLEKGFERDKFLGYTSYGVQNDDFLIKVNGSDLRQVGSQGQQRTATLALKLAEMEILKEEYGEYPVLLLDDVLSELDEVRRERLLKRIEGIQCILTCTKFNLELESTLFEVSNGVVNKKD